EERIGETCIDAVRLLARDGLRLHGHARPPASELGEALPACDGLRPLLRGSARLLACPLLLEHALDLPAHFLQRSNDRRAVVDYAHGDQRLLIRLDRVAVALAAQHLRLERGFDDLPLRRDAFATGTREPAASFDLEPELPG